MKTYHSIYYVAAACLTVEAHAHEMEPRRAEVHYRDLNLSTPSGRERLHNRVELAVKRLCEQTGVGNFFRRPEHLCRHRAFEKANVDMETVIAAADGN